MSQREREKRRPVTAARRVAEHSSGDRPALKTPEGLRFWRPKKPGSYKIEVVPYEVGPAAAKMNKSYAKPGEWYYERTFFTHAGVGPNSESYVCSAKTFGKPCPICEEWAALMKSPNKEAAEMAKQLRPKERQLFLIVDHDEEQYGVQLWEVSNFCFGKQLDAKLNGADPEDRDRYMNFADPDEGSTLKLLASEEALGSGNNKFLKFSVDEIRTRRQPLDPAWVDHGYCLDAMIAPVPYDQLKRIFLQTGGDDDEQVDDAQPTRRPVSRQEEDDAPPARSKRPSVDEDDAPPARKAAKAPPPDDDEGGPPPARKGWKVGDAVAYTYRKTEFVGEITKIDVAKEIATVQAEGTDRPHVVDLEDLSPAPARRPVSRQEEDDDTPPARSKRPPVDEDDAPPARKKAPPPDDDDPPARKAAKAAGPDDEPAPRKKAVDWDDDDEPAPRKKADADDDAPPARRGR